MCNKYIETLNKMKRGLLTFIIILTCCVQFTHSQESLNQLDKNGNRHGYWSKNYDGTEQKRYEGQFNHGKEVGLFKYYKLERKKSVLSATKEFNENDSTALVKFFTSKGKLVSQGKMNGKLYVDKWLYYHKNNDGILTEEHYNPAGQLHGKRLTYFENGQLAESLQYKNGLLDGNSIWYSNTGQLYKSLEYKDGELHGEAKFYDNQGQLIIEGNYKNDLRAGTWNYYKEGKLDESRLYDESGRWINQ